MNIASVLIGTDVATGLVVHRRQLYFRASTVEDIIQVFYDEFFLVNGQEVAKKNDKYYTVKDIVEGSIVNGVEVEETFLGFTNWVNYDIGAFPNGTTLSQVLVGAINNQLQLIPIGVTTGYIITE